METSSTSDLADEIYASRVVNMLLSSHPHQAHDPKTLMRQLTVLCTGEPKEVLRRMVDPRDGLVAESEFVPTIAKVKGWLEARRSYRTPREAPEHKLLPPLQEEQVSPEERARRVKRLKDVARVIRATTKAKVIGRPLNWKRTQAKDHSALVETDLVKDATP